MGALDPQVFLLVPLEVGIDVDLLQKLKRTFSKDCLHHFEDSATTVADV